MRHAKLRHQLNRSTSWRRATILSLAKNLIIQQSIKTTKAKALAARPLIEKLISLAKKNTLAAKRHAFKILGDHKLVSLLFSDIGPRFTKRTGGYIRILNLGQRRGDNAKMVILELTEIKKKEPKKPKKIKTLHTEEITKPQAPQAGHEEKPEEKKPKTEVALKERPPISKKPAKKFFGGLRQIFKKKSDSL